MAICKSNAVYQTYRVHGEIKAVEYATTYGSHIWNLRHSERRWKRTVVKPPTKWYHYILRFLGAVVGETTFDVEPSGKIYQVWDCQYCRVTERRDVDEGEG